MIREIKIHRPNKFVDLVVSTVKEKYMCNVTFYAVAFRAIIEVISKLLLN